MTEIQLSPHQQTALDWLVTQLTSGTPLVALRGLAGTGKSTMIPALRDALRSHGLPVAIGAPTHRAAMILRRKGITDADTVHSLALTPYFTADYTQAMRWLGEDVPCQWKPDDLPHADIDGVPWLIAEAVKPQMDLAQDLRRQRTYPAKKRLESLGISGRDYFAGFGAKAGEGVLIIDEASMVGTAMLALCQQAFPQICLVGDPGQLPPVKDTAQLSSVDGFDLQEIHRQAADSPIVQLAYRARNGEPFWRERLMQFAPNALAESIQEGISASAREFLMAPLIVWKNDTRKTCTHAIRAALGFARELLYVGEPLVCRSTSKEDRSEGFYNNGLYAILEADPAHPRRVTVVDALGQESSILAHLEELDGDKIDPRAIPFRFGYALTAHAAQGGEWPTVYISLPDLKDYVGFCARTDRALESAQWCYTAITRAKETLCFLTTHHFTSQEDMPMASPKSGPTLAPMLQQETAPAAPMPDPSMPDEHTGWVDDVLDPPVPATLAAELATAAKAADSAPTMPTTFGEHTALLHGFCEALQGQMGTWMRDYQGGMDRVIVQVEAICKQRIEALGTANDHALYQFSTALTQLQERGMTVTMTSNPYVADIAALSPEGFPVTLHIVKADAGVFIQALGEATKWLAAQGYTMPPAAVAF